MKIYAETERLVLRAFVEEDAISFFEMDSDPLVHIYLGNNPITTIEQAASTIADIRKQYVDFGLGR